jgi:hypothetical protein
MQMKGEQREQTMDVARTWGKLAQDRSCLVHRHPELPWEASSRKRCAWPRRTKASSNPWACYLDPPLGGSTFL